MSYDDFKNALTRGITWLVVLELDYCEHEFGEGPCTASGTPCCYYTWTTCKDAANYSAGKKEYWFSLAKGPAIAGALPCLEGIKTVPTEIRPEEDVTRRARLTIELIDDAPTALANPDKNTSNPETGGSFFKNLIARNPNYEGRSASILQGFPGLAVNEYKLCFKGVVDSLEYEEGRCRIIIKDQLKLLDKKTPPQTSSDNVLVYPYDGGFSMNVTGGDEFEPPGCIKIGAEYILFSGKMGNTLMGCMPGKYGSSQQYHDAGEAIKQVTVFADEDSGEGISPDEIFLSLLCRQGGISPFDIAVTDSGAVLAGDVSQTDMSVPVDMPEKFPQTGIIRIGDEMIIYRGVQGSSLEVWRRGVYGTSLAEHSAGGKVYLALFTAELGLWMSGTRYRRFVENPVSVKDLVNELRRQVLLHVWQSEDSTIKAKVMAPPLYNNTPKRLDDETGLIYGSTSWKPGLKMQTTRISVYYDAAGTDAGDNPADYNGLLLMIDADAESEQYFGREKSKEVFSRWIYREHEAMLLASRYLVRYGKGASCFKFAVELKDADLEVGDFVTLDTRDILLPSGLRREDALFEVIKKQQRPDNLVEYKAIDTSFSRRYPVISPPELDCDYGDASKDEKRRYGWIGDADNRVGPDLEDGYYIY